MEGIDAAELEILASTFSQQPKMPPVILVVGGRGLLEKNQGEREVYSRKGELITTPHHTQVSVPGNPLYDSTLWVFLGCYCML